MEKNSAQNLFVEDNGLHWEDLGNGVSRKIITYDDKLMLVKVVFEKNAVGAVHHHPHTQISYIEKGSFEVNINGEKRVMETGGSFYIPPDAPHGVICLQEGVLIDVFSPMREDLI
ncbi:MAG: pectin degradation protein KdgF [Ferruginibacter sp.]|nr:pectin degradation protein KdgF [Ferruginibacter sp.]